MSAWIDSVQLMKIILLGITHLSNRASDLPNHSRSPEQIVSDCIRQPGSRVRTAVIALFLLHPEFAELLPKALDLLNENQGQLLRLFYTAAVYLQQIYHEELLPIAEDNWRWLPDQYGPEFGILPGIPPQEALRQLGKHHQTLFHSLANWTGTYENAARHLVRYKQREQQWNRSPRTLIHPINTHSNRC